MQNQELFCFHPNIVRSSLKNLKEADIDRIKFPQLLIEAELQWNIKTLREHAIFPSILCKYHNTLSRVNGQHPFSWAMSEISKYWPQIIDYLWSHEQSDAQLMFLKEFILDLFSLTREDHDSEAIHDIRAIQYDIIDLISDLPQKSFVVRIIHDVLEILPKKPIQQYFSTCLRLIKITTGNGQFELFLDQLITRFEMGYPIMEISLLIRNWDYRELSLKSEIALIFCSAIVLSNSLDKEVCSVWVSILDNARRRIEKWDIQINTIVLKRLLVWPLTKIKTEKTCENGKLL